MRRALPPVVLVIVLALGCSSASGPGDGGDCNLLGVVPIDFGPVPLQPGGKSLNLEIENLGSSPVTLGTAWVDGGDAADFVAGATILLQGQGGPLLPGQAAEVPVTFTPGADGEESTVIEIPGDGCTRGVVVTGTGITPTTAVPDAGGCLPLPTTIAFPNVVVGGSSSLPLAVQNCGPGSSVVVGPIFGADPVEFSLADGGPVLFGQTQTFQVTFSPVHAGPSTAQLEFAVCAGCPAIALSGTGLLGVINCSPDPLSLFGDGGVDVSCSNVGNWLVEVAGLFARSNGQLSVVDTPLLPMQLAPQQSFELGLDYVSPSGQSLVGSIEADLGPPGQPASWQPIVSLVGP